MRIEQKHSTSMDKISLTALIFVLILSLGKQDALAQNTPFDSLVWSDEFNGSGSLDTSKWFHQTKLPPWGEWFGGLINHYTDRQTNSYQQDGYMHLVAKKETFSDQGKTKDYTSARLNSKFVFRYGRVEVRAKLPKGIGTWPAIWMLNKNINEDGAYWQTKGFGTTNWPHCGEVDILEHWGTKQDHISSAVHNGSSYGDYVVNVGGREVEEVSDQFHTYQLEWTDEKMVFSIDGIAHYVYNPSVKDSNTWPYDEEYYLIMNIAIEKTIEDQFDQSEMTVDYIRIYQ